MQIVIIAVLVLGFLFLHKLEDPNKERYGAEARRYAKDQAIATGILQIGGFILVFILVLVFMGWLCSATGLND